MKTLPIFTFTHFYFIPFAFTLHYVLIKSLFDLEDSVVQVLIWLNKKCGINSFWHPFMRLLVLSWLSIFHVVRYWFHLHYSTHVYCWVLHPISKWFHLLSDNTGKIWVETYFQIEIRVKFILTLKVCLGWLPLFTHIEFWWQEKFFYHL